MIKTRPGTIARRAAIAGVLPSASLLLAPSSNAAYRVRDGSHDFDWEVELWKTHLKVLRQKPDGSSTWVRYEGTSDVIPTWNCRAVMVDSAYSVQSISENGGRTWHPSWMAHDTRVAGTADARENLESRGKGAKPMVREGAMSSAKVTARSSALWEARSPSGNSAIE